MTSKTLKRSAMSQIAPTAVTETKLAAQAALRFGRHAAPIVLWASAAILLGLLVGFASVVLPPTGTFGIVAFVFVILLWVMPDLPIVATGAIRKTFLVMFVTDLIVPYYYTIQVSGLPWISVRRVATFAFIMPFLIAVAGSSDVRRRISERLRSTPLILICFVGFLSMLFLSMFRSLDPTETLSSMADAILSWYVPFFGMVYIINDDRDVVLIFRIICICALINAVGGFVEFYFQHKYLLDIFPKGMLANLLENNQSIRNMLLDPFRDGQYRAASTFMDALSFGQFEIIALPIGLFFALHRNGLFEKSLGWAVVLTTPVALFCAQARGGWMGLLVSMAVFVVFWSMRKFQANKTSLAPGTVGLAGALAFATILVLINTWGRAHNMVLGGGNAQYSSDMRQMQWDAGWPLIFANPITGHGFSEGAEAIAQPSIDSYPLSLLVETGVPGLVFFAGMVLLPVWYGLRNYLIDKSERGSASGALACSFIAFVIYSLVLSQRENHMFIFILVAVFVVTEHRRAKTLLPVRGTETLRVRSVRYG